MKAWMEAHRITELNEKALGSKAGRRLSPLLTKMRNCMETQYVGRIFLFRFWGEFSAGGSSSSFV